MSTSVFPPASIAVNTAAIVDECEILEMTPNNDPAVPIVEIAALLYMGDYIHARHCWRRHREAVSNPQVQAALSEWWKLGQALMIMDMPATWKQLTYLQTTQPAPYKDYAQSIGMAVCVKLLPKLMQIWQQPRDNLLGLPRSEWSMFLEQHRQKIIAASASPEKGSAKEEIISFLEGPFLAI